MIQARLNLLFVPSKTKFDKNSCKTILDNITRIDEAVEDTEVRIYDDEIVQDNEVAVKNEEEIVKDDEVVFRCH